MDAFADSIDHVRLEREALAPLRRGEPARFLRQLYDVTARVETDAEPPWREWQANEERHRAEVRPEQTVDLLVLG